jgi:teichuronic acid biosynthesis glycosyltransferase TuaC
MNHFYNYIKKKDSNYKFNLIYSGRLNLFGLITAIRNIRKNTTNIDIAHSQYGSLISLLVVIFSKAKYNVVSLRGSDFYRLPFADVKLFDYFHSLLSFSFTKITLFLCRNIIFMSERMFEESNYPKNINSIVLPDPLNSYFIKFKEKYLKSQRQNNKTFTIGFAAQEKNSSVKNLKFANDIISKVKLKHNINFLVIQNSNPSDMPANMARIDLLLLTSKHEGFPNVIKEALFMGIPFASTDVSDLRLATDFIPGSFVCSGSSSEFADKISSNIALGLYGKSTINISKAYKNYISQFYPTTSAKKLITFYDKVLKNE